MTSMDVSPGMNHIDGGPGTVVWSQNKHAGHKPAMLVVICYLCASWMACIAAVRRTQTASTSSKTKPSKDDEHFQACCTDDTTGAGS